MDLCGRSFVGHSLAVPTCITFLTTRHGCWLLYLNATQGNKGHSHDVPGQPVGP
jgi:hypothetical protein